MARSGSDPSGVELGGDPESGTTIPPPPWAPGDDRNAGLSRREPNKASRSCVATGCGVSFVGFVIVVIALSVALSQLGGCDFELGPGEGKHSKHLKVGVSKTTDLVDGERVTMLSTAFDKDHAV